MAWAEGEQADRWPKPADVHRFARLYGVPRADLAGLVGMLSMRPYPGMRETWIDAVRDPERATPDQIKQHSRAALRAFGWFLCARDLGWVPPYKGATLH